jgi:vitamin B12 transporter
MFNKFIFIIIILSYLLSEEYRIVDIITGYPIKNAHIITKNQPIQKSDKNGNVVLNLESELNILIRKQGYYDYYLTPSISNLIKLKPIIFKHKLIEVKESFYKNNQELNHPTNLIKKSLKIKSNSQISDIFNTLPGMTIKSYGGIAGIKTLSLNGSQGDRIQVRLNGVIINNEQSGNADISQIPAGLIQNIQFIPIGASSRYGNSAMAGVINISPNYKAPIEINFSNLNGGHSINHFYSSSFKDQHFGYGIGILKSKQYISWNEEGQYNEDSNTHKNYDWFTSQLKQKYIHLWNSSITPNYSRNSFVLKTINNRIHSSKIYGPEYHPIVNDGIFLIGNNFIFNRINLNTSFKSQWIDYNSINNFTPPIYAKHKLNVLKNDLEIKFEKFSIINQLISTQSISNSTYPEDTISFQTHFGLSYRNINSIVNTFMTYRMALQKYENTVHTFELIFNKYFSQAPLISSMIYSKNYKKPNFNDLFWQPFGNKNLQIEYSNNFYLNFKLSTTHYIFELLNHRIKYNNMIQWLPKPGNQDYWSPENIKSAISIGETFSINTQNYNKINIASSISHNYSKDLSNNKKNAYTPEWIISSTISFSHEDIIINLSQFYQSKRYINMTDYLGNQRIIPSYNTINLNLTKFITKNRLITQISLLINNITNTRFQSVYGYPELGRTIEIQFTLKTKEKE